MLLVEGLSKFYGARAILDEVSWQLAPGVVVGLIGPNGAGKTTLMRILAGEEEADSGKIVTPKGFQIGFLPQEIALSERSGTLMDTILKGRSDLLELENRVQELSRKLAEDPTQLAEYDKVQEEFRSKGGWEFRSTAREIASGMGFTADQFDLPITSFSGGWQMRALLARLLFRSPDLLLLDEPTNHLDLESIEWLERFLGRYEGSVIIVSHDRFFLNRMVNLCVELEAGSLNIYHGNYDFYEERKVQILEERIAKAARQEKDIARVEAFIERFRSKATKAKQVQSRVKALEKVERIDVGQQQRAAIRFRFPQPPRLGKVAIAARGVHKAFGSNVVYSGIDIDFFRGERVALVGPNGAGKSTMLKILAGALRADAGSVELGSNAETAYFAQHALEALNPSNTVLVEAQSAATMETASLVRDMLGAFGFSGDDVGKQISVLSGGEKSRVALCKLMLNPAGVLLLDEPTNHLDMASKEVLEDALVDFEGVVIFVSHDRHFINQVATRTVHLENGKADSYAGNFDYYREKRAEEAEEGAQSKATNSSPKQNIKRLQAELRQKKSLELKTLKPELESCESLIEKLEGKKSELQKLMADPSLYNDSKRAQEVSLEFRKIEDELVGHYERWELLSEEIGEIEARYQLEEEALQR